MNADGSHGGEDAGREPPASPEGTGRRTRRFDPLAQPEPAGQGGEPPAIQEAEQLPAGTALLTIRRGPDAGARFLLDREITTVGRHREATVFLDDVTVSRRHAEFRRRAGGFTVADLGSLNGTYVNHEPVDSSPLRDGDEIQIGKFRLVFTTSRP